MLTSTTDLKTPRSQNATDYDIRLAAVSKLRPDQKTKLLTYTVNKYIYYTERIPDKDLPPLYLKERLVSSAADPIYYVRTYSFTDPNVSLNGIFPMHF